MNGHRLYRKNEIIIRVCKKANIIIRESIKEVQNKLMKYFKKR